MINKYYKLIGNQDGAVAIIVALVMTTFLGFAALAIDVGVMGFSKNELQNAADAAALAGASELARQDFENSVNPTPIKQAAIRAAGLNYTSSNDIQINLTNNDVALRRWDWDTSDFSNASPPPYNAVEVTISNHNVNLFFANDRAMNAHAVAIVGPTSSLEGLLPIAIDLDAYDEMIEEGNNYIYEFGQSPGNWGTINLNTDENGNPASGGGASDIQDYLDSGYPGIVKVGESRYSQTGVGPVNSYKNKDSLYNKRWFIPVIDGFGNGNSLTNILGFIAIEITEISGKGQKTTIHAHYLEPAIIGGGVDLGNQNFGVVSVKLVK